MPRIRSVSTSAPLLARRAPSLNPERHPAMIETSTDIQKLAVALLAFQADVRGVLKDAKNPHFKNRYASLEAVIEAARPGLQANGIAFLQAPGAVVNSALEVSTMLIHAASGQWLRSTMQIPMAKADPQGAGSAVTYAQRYSLMAALGIPPVEHLDDDAETAMGRGTAPTTKPDPAVAAPVVTKPGSVFVGPTLIAALNLSKSLAELTQWLTDNRTVVDGLPKEDRDAVEKAYKAKFATLKYAKAA